MALPLVLTEPADELFIKFMRLEAEKAFVRHTIFHGNQAAWLAQRQEILSKIAEAVNLQIDHDLDTDLEITASISEKDYRIDKICFRSTGGRYITGCLYVPHGEGPFPAVINLHGHHVDGHLAPKIQHRSRTLAASGFVCLNIDTFGSGERAPVHGEFAPHGGYQGTLLNNFGETLIGLQISDNIRAVDLLTTLPFVDPEKIGVTGASGGGNQTIYLAAFDERIKAALPVCNVGTYTSYIMGPNCICEMIPNVLNICEEAAVIAAVAPRKITIVNGLFDEYSSFTSQEMFRTRNAAKAVFQTMGVPENLNYRIFPTKHAYAEEALQYMISFFSRHLKGLEVGEHAPLPDIELIPPEDIYVYPKGQRPEKVKSIFSYCATLSDRIGARAANLEKIEIRAGLEKALNSSAINASCVRGGFENGYYKLIFIRDNGLPIPALMRPSSTGNFRVLAAPFGKQQLENNEYLKKSLAEGDGVLLIDLFASGETGKEYNDPWQWDYHKTGRSLFLMGASMLGEWVRDYDAVVRILKEEFGAKLVTLYGLRDTALAGVLAAALYGNADALVLDELPATLDWSRETPGFNVFTLAVCTNGILEYGDVNDFLELIDPEIKVTINSRLHIDGKIEK